MQMPVNFSFLITYRVYLSIIAIADVLLLFILGGYTGILKLTGHHPIYR